jgi:PAT family beta-lactamase induction signal transducer AmpG
MLDSLRVHTRPRLLAVLLMGFASGLPLLLTFSTLSAWLRQEGVSRTAIGVFALVGISYSWKFVWSPLIDRLPLPYLTRRFGQRRGWLMVIQPLLIAAILALGMTTPGREAWLTASLAALVAFLSASQDIVIDAYRIEILAEEEQAAGAAATQWGYRLGLLAAGSGALMLAALEGWHFTYATMAACMLLGLATTIACREPARTPANTPAAPPGDSALAIAVNWVKEAVIAPFAQFMTRPAWLAILIFVVLYKLGDAMLGVMAAPFYIDMKIPLDVIGAVRLKYGFIATLLGLGAGWWVIERIGMYPGLLVCGIAQALSNLGYVVLAQAGNDYWTFVAVLIVEDFTGGMGSTAFVAYLSGLCNVAFTATQYALLSSFAAFGRTTLSASSGWLADQGDWALFFIGTTFAALPGLLMVLWLMRRFPAKSLATNRPALARDD